jgi:hypothetical protein
MKIVDESELQKLRNEKRIDFKNYSKTSIPEAKPEPKVIPKEDPIIKTMEGIVALLKETVSKLKDRDDRGIIDALKIMQDNFNKSLEMILSQPKTEPTREEEIIQEKPKKWSFSIRRNDRGHIEEVIAEVRE